MGLFCILRSFEVLVRFPVCVAEEGFKIVQALEAAVEQAGGLDLFNVGEGRDIGKVCLFGQLSAKTALRLETAQFGGGAAEDGVGAGAGAVVFFKIGFVLFRGGVELQVKLAEAPRSLDDFDSEHLLKDTCGAELLKEAGAEALIFELCLCGHGNSFLFGFVLFGLKSLVKLPVDGCRGRLSDGRETGDR